MRTILIEFDIAATLLFFLPIIKLFARDDSFVVHGQHIATTWQILRRVAHRWGRRYGVSAVLLVFEHEIDGTATPFCLPRWGGDPSLLELTHDAEYAQTIQI